MLTICICIIYLYIGGSFAVLVNKIGWFNLPVFQGDRGGLFFIRLIAWPVLFLAIPILLAYKKHEEQD